MNTKYEFAQEHDKTVYVRRVAIESLPKDVQDQAEGLEALYALHDASGERIALVKDRGLAFMLAKENEMSPVSVH